MKSCAPASLAAAAVLVAGVEAAVADVVHHGAGEEVGLLQHQAQRAAQIVLLDLVDVDAVVADLAVGDVVEAVDEVGDGGLARAGRADEGHLLAGLGIDRHVVQHVLALHIGKVHVRQPHVAAQRRIGHAAVGLVGMAPGPVAGALLGLLQAAVGLFLHVHQRHIALVRLGRLVDQAEDALRAGAGHDDGVDLLGELVDVAGKLARHVQEGDQDRHVEDVAGEAEVGHAREDQHAADQCEGHIEDVADVGDDRPEHAGIGVGLVADLVELLVDLVKVLDALLLMAEDLDDLLAVHRLLGEALHRATAFCCCMKYLAEPPPTVLAT